MLRGHKLETVKERQCSCGYRMDWSFGAVFCTITGFAFNELQVYSITRTYIIAFLVLSLLTGVVAFVFWNYAITKVGASKGGTFVYLIPVFGAVFGVVL